MTFRYDQYNFIISIDFGTTSSGTCFSDISRYSTEGLNEAAYPEITQVTTWPEQSADENKTPSIIIYDRNFHMLCWGKAARSHIENRKLKPGEVVKERFKLELPSFVPQIGAIYKMNSVKKAEHDNMRAIIDYLREIFELTLYTIKTSIGNGVASVEKDDIHFVLTVSAQWTDVQKAIMHTVAKEAGLITDEDHENRLSIINESFAASLHCEQEKHEIENIKPGDKYIICDAGGGTVNLATFESVKKVEGDPPDSFRRCQLTTASGSYCGSTLIDKELRKLLSWYYFKDGPEIGDAEEEKKRDKLFSGAINKFINNDKITFGRRSYNFSFPECNHEEIFEELDFDFPSQDSDEGDPNDDQCIICKLEDFKYLDDKKFGNDITIVLEDAIIIPQLKFRKSKYIKHKINAGTCTLVIKYSILAKEVFDPVVNNTIELIDRQIKKANGNISRTFLVGGFGYPKWEYKSGQLLTDSSGSSAVMRGAIVYGIDSSRSKFKTDFVKKTFEHASTDKYNTLICLNIGYLTTSCSYRNLKNESDEMTDIIDWPGIQETSFMIRTTKENVGNITRWGAQADHYIGSGHSSHNNRIASDNTGFISPCKLMSVAKDDLRHYLCDNLKLVLGHVHEAISKTSPQLANRDKYRYVITIENCYQFFDDKSEMRHIAQLAGIVSPKDSLGRLLLIGRDNAAAMYNEKRYFSDKSIHCSHVLQINMYGNICNLSLMAHTKINGTNIDSKNTDDDEEKTKFFRNVRSVRSATFDFDFIGKIVSNLNDYISKNACVECTGSHNTYSPTYYAELRRGFLEYIKTSLNFNNNIEIQNIPTTDAGCCTVSIKMYDLLGYIFCPAVKDFASEINRFATQTGMTQRFSIDNVFLSGFLFETNVSNYEFLEKAILGAAIYGNNPTYFTERIARTSYAVNIRAYTIKEFDNQAKEEIEKEKAKGEKDLKKRIYDVESTYSYITDEKVDLFYQSPHNYFVYTSDLDRKDDDLTCLIRRGDKIFEKDQKEGILKKFYAHRDCMVYATIYASDVDDLPTEGIKANNCNFRKIHQFELYVKRDEDDPMTAGDEPRLHFDIRLIINNNEAIFEARVGSRLGKKIPEYHFKDEFLVANIYDDRPFTEVGDLTIDKGVSELSVGK